MNTALPGTRVIDLLRAIHRQLELVDRTTVDLFLDLGAPALPGVHDDQNAHGHRQRQVDLAALVRIRMQDLETGKIAS